MALDIARILDGKQAQSIVIVDVSGPLVIADYFVVATVRNPRHGTALARELDGIMKQRGKRRRNSSGFDGDEPNWVLRDYDEIIVHLFLKEARAFYDLESLWADVPRLPFTPDPHRPATETPEAAPRRSSGTPFRILPDTDPDDEKP